MRMLVIDVVMHDIAAIHPPAAFMTPPTQARKEAEEWKPRLDAAQTELFKLERALELKVSVCKHHQTLGHYGV